MDEASSKYVDQIATQRLTNDKLSKVHHRPNPADAVVDTSFGDFKNIRLLPEGVVETPQEKFIEITFPSTIQTRYTENNRVYVRCFPARQPVGDILFVHGLYEDNMDIYKFFISQLVRPQLPVENLVPIPTGRDGNEIFTNPPGSEILSQLNEQGLNVYLLVLPFHYDRTPQESRFSGEYYWSADVHRSALAFKQAVYDLCQLYQYVKTKSGRPVWITGFSMGGGVALSTVTLIPVDGIFVINPVCNITELMWHSALFSTIKTDLEANGLSFNDIKTMYSLYEPLNVTDIQIPREKVVLAKSLYDQINDPRNYELFTEKWRLEHVISYKAGHLNILRVPKLASDLVNFYFARKSD